jgi:hypothetical protein
LASLRYLSTEVDPQNDRGGFDVRALTEVERQCLTETQSLTRDEEGREVLAGLTYEESSLLMAYRRQFTAGKRDQDPLILSMWLELSDRHVLARPTNDLITAGDDPARVASVAQLCGSWCGGNLLAPLP